MTDKILGFKGKYRWLSNFVDCPIMYEGVLYPSTENAYQAAKTLDLEARKQFETLTAFDAKKAGKTVPIRPDWEAYKLLVMFKALRQKFTQEPFRTKLLNTGDAYIEETNYWGDTFWGVCNGVGENYLGKIIMELRILLNDTDPS